MLTLPPTVQIFLAREPADLRKSFDGLAALVRGALDADPLCGHLFVFRNKRGDRLKSWPGTVTGGPFFTSASSKESSSSPRCAVTSMPSASPCGRRS